MTAFMVELSGIKSNSLFAGIYDDAWGKVGGWF